MQQERLSWQDFDPADTLRFLGYLRQLPSKRAAQRLGLTVVVGGPAAPGTLLSPATVNRVLAGVSSFFDWAIAAEEYTRGESPFQVCDDQALARVPERHQPFMGRASRQRPVRRVASVRKPMRLPRPMAVPHVEAFLASLAQLRDLAIFLPMRDGGLRPGEVLSLRIEDISYGRRRMVIRKRDDHPRGARGKSRAERMVEAPRLQPKTPHRSIGRGVAPLNDPALHDDVLRSASTPGSGPRTTSASATFGPTKTQQKISGRLTSEDVTQDRLDIRSYIDTARKHGADVITALRLAITGNP